MGFLGNLFKNNRNNNDFADTNSISHQDKIKDLKELNTNLDSTLENMEEFGKELESIKEELNNPNLTSEQEHKLRERFIQALTKYSMKGGKKGKKGKKRGGQELSLLNKPGGIADIANTQNLTITPVPLKQLNSIDVKNLPQPFSTGLRPFGADIITSQIGATNENILNPMLGGRRRRNKKK
jgi:hypothetical protein